jgi:hypothetical protein
MKICTGAILSTENPLRSILDFNDDLSGKTEVTGSLSYGVIWNAK